MASPRKRTASIAPQWEVKAKGDLAIWRQHPPIAKAIAQSEIIVRCATQRGLAINKVKSHNFAELLESPAYRGVRQEAEAQMERWEANMAVMDDVVHASFLVDAAKEAGIDVGKVRQYPFFTSPATQHQASQANFPCSDCVALETSLACRDEEEDDGSMQGEQPSLRDGEEGQSQQPLF
jgi:hypothetical protein